MEGDHEPKFLILSIDCIIQSPSSSPTHPPVLYYTVTHNVSGNGSELTFNTTTNEASLSGLQHGETYSISVYALNAFGKGLPANATISG